MIGFDLSEEQLAIKEMAARFARNEMLPSANKYDLSGEFPHEIAQKAHELGLINIIVPEKYGGSGRGMLDLCIIAEEMSYACAGMAVSFVKNNIALTPLLIFGNDEQKEAFLKPICSSEEVRFASFALTESDAGSDVSSIRTKGELKDGTYVLNGRKTFITNGDLASVYIVFASTDRTKKHKGLSSFIVPKEAGIEVGKKEDKIGIRASPTVELILDEVKVPKENLLGNKDSGFYIALNTLDRTRALVASMACGLAQRALDECLKYATARIQFGRPLINHQLIQSKLADMSMEIDAARLLTWRAAWLTDQEKRPVLESSQAKAFAADVAMRVTTQAVQIFGGYGCMKDYPVEKLMRDAKIFQIFEGTNEIQRLTISAELAKRI